MYDRLGSSDGGKVASRAVREGWLRSVLFLRGEGRRDAPADQVLAASRTWRGHLGQYLLEESQAVTFSDDVKKLFSMGKHHVSVLKSCAKVETPPGF